jgi:hypothetical protein
VPQPSPTVIDVVLGFEAGRLAPLMASGGAFIAGSQIVEV